MGLIGTHRPSFIGLFCPQLINWFVDPQPVLPNSNSRKGTVRVLALALPPAPVGYPLNLLQAPQPLCGPGSAASSTCPFPVLALTVGLSVCVAEAGWPRHCGEAAPRRLQRQRTLQAIYLSVTTNIVMLRPRPRHRCFLAFLGTPDQSSLTRPSAITQPPQRLIM